MRAVITSRARRDLGRQLDYLIDRGAAPAARRLERRFISFVENTLTTYPRTGKYLGQRDLWETWIPRTRLVVWYRFTDEALEVVRVWHTSQDRQGERS